MIHNIYTSRTRQKPLKDSKQSSSWILLHFPQNQTLTLLTLLLLTPLPLIVVVSYHSLLDSAKALLGLLRHGLFPRERVAPQVHLPAWYAVHHSRVLVVPMRHPRSIVPPPLGAHRPHELRVGLGPLVQVDVGGPDRHAGIAGVADTVWYTNWGHFLCSAVKAERDGELLCEGGFRVVL